MKEAVAEERFEVLKLKSQSSLFHPKFKSIYFLCAISFFEGFILSVLLNVQNNKFSLFLRCKNISSWIFYFLFYFW